jgi:hypothetical protein
MSRNIPEIPITELVERMKKLLRTGDNTDAKIRGVITDIYCREIPAKWDWNFLLVGSSIVTDAEYHVGNATLNTGDTTVLGGGGASFSSGMVGRMIKFGGNPTTYDITGYTNSTTLTINPALWGDQNITSGSYSIFQPRYSLASDFERFPKPGGVYSWVGGRKQVLEEVQYANYVNDYYQSVASTPDRTRLFGTDTLGNTIVEMIPPPRDSKVYGYEYIKRVRPLLETTGGLVNSIAVTDRTVTLSGNIELGDVKTDGSCFFRVDNFGTGENSTWYRILAVTGTNQLTLATAFANTAVTAGASYTIAEAPCFPSRMHLAVMYGGARQLTADQNDPNIEWYMSQYQSILLDSKKIYVSRPYSQDVTGIFEDYRYRV